MRRKKHIIIARSGIDRRGKINRRQLALEFKLPERRVAERRLGGERRSNWVRDSKWSSVDLALKNRYMWSLLNT